MRRLVFVAIASGSCLVVAIGAKAPSVARQPQFRSTAEGVRIDVDVMDGSRPVTGLKAEDFEVTDEQVVQSVESARTVGQLAISFAVDVSLSVRPTGLLLIQRALEHAVGALQAQDRAAIVTFSDRIRPMVGLTTDPVPLRSAAALLTQQTAGEIPRTITWDAVFGAASLVAASDGRPVVILIGDGRDNASGLNQTELQRTLDRAGIIVDFVRAPMDKTTDDLFPPGRNAPEDLVTATRGVEFDAGDTSIGKKIQERLAALREGYVLTYVPTGVSAVKGWHRVTVRVPGRRVIVRARPGYYATPVQK